MNRQATMRRLCAVAFFSIVAVAPMSQLFGQTGNQVQPQATKQEKLAAETLAAEKRTFVVTQLLSLADEARGYNDLALRPRVLARIADTIWDDDSESARRIFRRAWDAAETADAEELSKKTEDRQLQMVSALKRAGGLDYRNEVLRMAARRDHALGEEFLAKLKEKTKEDPGNSQKSNSEDLERRLRLARSLLDNDQIDQALAFASPALSQVSVASISFLCALRPKRADAADQRFLSMTALAELDPAADANTVSLLSSYVFTPRYYVTFKPDGSAFWSFEEGSTTAPNLPPPVRAAFFKVAAAILLRPLPPPDQDFSTSGRAGKYVVMNRLMPRFQQYAPDVATALRSQLTSLRTEALQNRTPDLDRMSSLSNESSSSKPSTGDILETMQDKLDHAKNSKERDRISAHAATDLAEQGDERARDVADKIDDTELRNRVRGHVDFQLVRFAVLTKKDSKEALRLAKTGQLTHTERVWAYIHAARLLPPPERESAANLLEEAVTEAQRIAISDQDRARALFAITSQFMAIDTVRAWAVADEAVIAANSAETFSGEDTSIGSFPVLLRSGGTFETTTDNDFGIGNVFRLLANEDLYRSMDIARSLKRERPRALAILAVAGATLTKPTVQKNNSGILILTKPIIQEFNR